MPFYRKKPVIIEAFQLTEETRDNKDNWPNWMLEAWKKDLNEPNSLNSSLPYETKGSLWIYTMEGFHRVDIGDFIIKGVNGELYPCKADIFEKTYTPLNLSDAQ